MLAEQESEEYPMCFWGVCFHVMKASQVPVEEHRISMILIKGTGMRQHSPVLPQVSLLLVKRMIKNQEIKILWYEEKLTFISLPRLQPQTPCLAQTKTVPKIQHDSARAAWELGQRSG